MSIHCWLPQSGLGVCDDHITHTGSSLGMLIDGCKDSLKLNHNLYMKIVKIDLCYKVFRQNQWVQLDSYQNQDPFKSSLNQSIDQKAAINLDQNIIFLFHLLLSG